MRRSQIRRTAMKRWRPEPPTEEEKRTRLIVAARSEGWCELRLSGCLGRATDKAHRVGEGVGGPWSPSNILDSCRVCHRWCHANPAAAKDLNLMLESWQNPLDEPVPYCNAGWVLLDDDGGLWLVGDAA